MGVAVAERTTSKPTKPNRAERRRANGKGKRTVPLSAEAYLSLKGRMRGTDEKHSRHLPAYIDGHPQTFAPSEPWLDAQFDSHDDTGPDGEPISYYVHRPAGRHWEPVPTGHVRCKCCGHLNPPQCIGSSGSCDDCRLGAMSRGQLAKLPGSSSTISMAKVKAARKRGDEVIAGGI